MTKTERSVFISYSWGAEKKHPLVDELLAALKEKGIEVKRDSSEIHYGDSIRAYMDELAAGGAIILVLSEEYFKSQNCMYELREIYLNNRKEFRQRIFPVVLQGTKFHKTIDRIPYIRHWEEETEKLNAALGTVARENIGAVSHNELRDYADFRRMIDELLALISDMNHLTEEEHLKTGFSALIERMFSHKPPAGGGGADKTDREKAVGKLGTLFGVPDPPPNHFDRPEYLDQLRAAVLQGDTQAVGITGKRQHVGVQGMGGLGKSVLAAALAHDEAVRAAFPDGIFWLRFRQNVDDAYLLEQQAEILKIIAPGQLPDTLVNGENLLTLTLEDKRCLFIADDIWDSGHLRHFVPKSKGCRLLLTTRKAEVIKKINAVACELGLLDEKQARQFLAVCSGCAENDLPDEAAAIVQECGRLPLALAAIGSMVKDKPAKRWQTALEKLQNASLKKIPADLTLDYEYKNLFKVFQVSVEDLPPEVQAYYKTLIIFPEDATIPESVLQLYWEHCPQGDYEWQDAVDLLVARSLLSREKSLLSRNTDEFVTLHDLLRDYLKNQSGGDVASLHKQLLEACKAEYPGGWHTIPYIYIEKSYFFTKKGYTYFYMNWDYHAREAKDTVYAAKIADDLICNQPLLDMESLKIALKFVGYKLHDIAPRLLKINKDISVLKECLELLGNGAEKCDVLILLKETINRGDILNDKNKKLIILCLEILEKEAIEVAKELLGNNIDRDITYICLKILGKDGIEYARKFFKKGYNHNTIEMCLSLFGDDLREDARNLLKETDNSAVKMICIHFLGKEAKNAAIHILETTKDVGWRKFYSNLLLEWEKNDPE